MQNNYLLDTNIVSDIVKQPDGIIANKIQQIGEGSVYTSIIVASELRFGASKRNSARLTSNVDAILSILPVLDFEKPADKYYAILRVQLEKSGAPIGPNDMLIAAHALALDMIVVTANEAEFKRVSTLRVENWFI